MNKIINPTAIPITKVKLEFHLNGLAILLISENAQIFLHQKSYPNFDGSQILG